MNTYYCNPIGYAWVLKHEIPEPKTELIKDNDYICQVVSKYTGVSPERMKIRSRKREIVIARQLSMYFDKEFTLLSLKDIGANFDRHHTTVLHAIQAVNDLKDTNKAFNALFSKIKHDI